MIGSATGQRIGITGLGTNVPKTVMTNDDMARFVDTSDEWIRERTGIRERRIASQEEALTDIALPAVREAMAAGGTRQGSPARAERGPCGAASARAVARSAIRAE